MTRRRLPYATSGQLADAVLLNAEVVVASDTHRVHLGDGVTPGGVPLARQDEVDQAAEAVAAEAAARVEALAAEAAARAAAVDAIALVAAQAKASADAAASGRRQLAAVRMRTTANVDLAGGGLANGTTHDGQVAATGDRVFVGSQTLPAQNGVYLVPASGAATRATDADAAAELARATVYVKAGTAGAGETWTLPMEAGDIVVGTTALNWALAESVSSVAAELAALETAAPNLLVDPFLSILGETQLVAPAGTWAARDVDNPHGGGSLVATSGLTRLFLKLPKGVKAGDAVTVRQIATATTAPTHTLYFTDAAGTVIGSGVSRAGAIGANDVKIPGTVPALAVGIRVDMSGAGTAKVFALTLGRGTATPGLVQAPPEPDQSYVPTGNILPDPFLKRLGWTTIWPTTVGTWTAYDPANPFGGGSVSDFTGVLRNFLPLPTGVREGDVISVRQMATGATAATSHSLMFVNAAGTTIAGTTATTAGTSGLHARTMRATVPAGAVGIRVDLLNAGAGTGKVYALAMCVGTGVPSFVEAPPPADRAAVASAVAGKAVVLMGDSIIANSADSTALPPAFLDTVMAKLLEAPVTNCGIGGTTLALRSAPGAANYSALSMTALADAIASGNWSAQDTAAAALGGDVAVKIARLKAVAWADVHTVVVAFGTNDYSAGEAALGTTSDATGATFRGAMNNVVDKLLGAWPHLQIVFQTPLYRDRIDGGPNAASGTGSISGTTLTVTAKTVGAFTPGQTLFARVGMTKRTTIVSQLSGTTGGVGTYQLDRSQTVASTAISGMASQPCTTTPNGLGLTLPAYVDAMVERAGAHGVPVIDAFRHSGLNAQTVTRRTEDGLHQNPLIGLYELARFMARQLAQVVR